MSADLLPWDLLAPERRLFLARLGGGEAAAAAAVEARRRVALPHREEMARAVVSYLEGIGAPPGSTAAARRLADPRAVVVVGGQQPAVAGGPLLAFAKAAGVLALARRLEAAGGGPVVPVWWVASEDHDLAEAGAVWLGGGKRGSDLLKGDPGERRMLSRVPSPTEVEAAGDAGGSEFSCEVLRPAVPAGECSLGTATAAWFARTLGPAGLVVVEPQVLRPFARSIFERDIRDPGLLAGKVREGNAALRAAGFLPALADPEGPLHFTVDDGGRRARGGGTPADLDALSTRLSADVVLRVLAQDAALPVAAQVCGPTEFEYLAALRPAREAVGGFHPASVARPGLTILERRVSESLAEFGTDLAGLYRGGAAALRAPVPAGDDPLAAETRRLRDALAAAAGEPARHASAVRSRLERAGKALEELESAVRRADEEKRGVGESRRKRILDALLPDGVPQERRWALLPFLLRHGPGLVERLVAECSGPEPGHRVIRV